MLMTTKTSFDDVDNFILTAKAISSPVRANILKLLVSSSMTLSEIARILDQPMSSTAQNIKLLEDAGLIKTTVSYSSVGKSRTCYRTCDKIEFVLFDGETHIQNQSDVVEHSIPIGAFSSYNSIVAPCGLTGKNGFFGNDDDPSLFFYPQRYKCALLWFTSGNLEYRANLPMNPFIEQLEISFEACSEAPLFNPHYKSDITIWINDLEIGTWTCPGDFGGRKGQFTPDYWPDTHTQFGMLTNWKIDNLNTTMNGEFISYTNLRQIDFKKYPYLSLRIGVKDDAAHRGGINLFGKDFGDYQQDIIVRYKQKTKTEGGVRKHD